MGTVFLDMVMSLDGFVAGPDNTDSGLHDWYFAPAGNATFVIDELLETIGAMILGNRAFGEQPEGFDTPYHVPHFVLSHTARPTIVNGEASFIFVDSIESALAQAREAAGEKSVCVAGGAATAQQLLNAGLIDELQIHIVPMLLGGGLRLFDQIKPVKLEQTRVLESPGVTHMRFAVLR
ncbi:MAG: dihydrofolate reductase [Herpetosiphonaceae bacterium]|nr:dihydrofolate reductase [Herpetosiphonaceae bacterium]